MRASAGGNSCLALNAAVQQTRAKRKVKTRKIIGMLVKVPRRPVGGCAKNSSAAQGCQKQWTACDSVISPEHDPDHEAHGSIPGAVGTFNLPPESHVPIWEIYGWLVAWWVSMIGSHSS